MKLSSANLHPTATDGKNAHLFPSANWEAI